LQTKVPVRVTVYVPAEAAVNVHDPVDVPPGDRVALGEHDAVSSEGVDTATVTGPASPERLVKLTVLLPDEPVVNETDEPEML